MNNTWVSLQTKESSSSSRIPVGAHDGDQPHENDDDNEKEEGEEESTYSVVVMVMGILLQMHSK